MMPEPREEATFGKKNSDICSARQASIETSRHSLKFQKSFLVNRSNAYIVQSFSSGLLKLGHILKSHFCPAPITKRKRRISHFSDSQTLCIYEHKMTEQDGSTLLNCVSGANHQSTWSQFVDSGQI